MLRQFKLWLTIQKRNLSKNKEQKKDNEVHGRNNQPKGNVHYPFAQPYSVYQLAPSPVSYAPQPTYHSASLYHPHNQYQSPLPTQQCTSPEPISKQPTS